jgi:hypothetical protein
MTYFQRRRSEILGSRKRRQRSDVIARRAEADARLRMDHARNIRRIGAAIRRLEAVWR